jgi:hypothetical protein
MPGLLPAAAVLVYSAIEYQQYDDRIVLAFNFACIALLTLIPVLLAVLPRRLALALAIAASVLGLLAAIVCGFVLPWSSLVPLLVVGFAYVPVLAVVRSILQREADGREPALQGTPLAAHRRPAVRILASAGAGVALAVGVLFLSATVAFTVLTQLPDNPPLGPKPTNPPNAGPADAPSGETPAQASRRLFTRVYSAELTEVDKPGLLHGAEPGEPVPVVRDYGWGPNVGWVLPEDRKSVRGNMFAAMWPLAMEKDRFIVPMVKDGRSVDEMIVYLEAGSWVASSAGGYDAVIDGRDVKRLPRGDVAALESASTRLKQFLGEATVVRAVVFVPSGNAFAVGDNVGREAAVFLGWSKLGPGISDHHGPALASSQFGQLFSHDELASLFGGSR